MIQHKTKSKSWPCRRLRYVVEFIEERHGGLPSLKDISEVLGLSTNSISAIFLKDDMKLSRAEWIASRYGYRLTLFFPVKEIFFEYGRPRLADYPNAGNLSGLAKYLRDSNVSMYGLKLRIGGSEETYKTAFRTGDIFLSTLERITDEFNIDVVWKFEKIS